AIAYKNRGEAKQAKGDAGGANEDLKRAGELDPRLRDEESSADSIDRGIAKGKEKESAAPVEDFFNRAGVKKAAGDLDGAIADYDRAIRLDPKYAYAYYNRGLAKKQKSDLDGAIADYNRVIELDSKFAKAYCDRGVAKRRKGDLDGAISDYDRTVELDPK